MKNWGSLREAEESDRVQLISPRTRAELVLTTQDNLRGQTIRVLIQDVAPCSVQVVCPLDPPPCGTHLFLRVGTSLWAPGRVVRTTGHAGGQAVSIALDKPGPSENGSSFGWCFGTLRGTCWFFCPPGIRKDAFSSDFRLRRLRTLVYRHHAGKVTVAQAACISGVEPSYFSTFFRRSVGLTFREWLQCVRLGKSLIIFATRDYSISQVAEKVGFQNRRSFERIFRRHTGLTPRQFKTLQCATLLPAN